MPIIETKRGDIFYKDYRKDDFTGLPYLLIHGAGSQYRDYHSKMRRALQAIAIDLPGHGKSPRRESISMENYAADIIAFIQAMNLEKATLVDHHDTDETTSSREYVKVRDSHIVKKVILVGHSMGGGIAQQIALDYPQYIHGLILIATGANLVVNEAIINGIIEKPEETAYLVTKWSWGKAADEKLLQQGVQHLLETPVDVIQGDYIACDNFDVRERLHEIQIPTLVIAGTLDKMTQLAWNEELAEKIPNATLKVFENSGHQVHVEQVEAVMDVMKEWGAQL